MGQEVIRNIDDRVLERLSVRAAAQRKSLEQSLRDLLSEAAAANREELRALAERIRAMTLTPTQDVSDPTAEELNRQDRDLR